MYFFALELPHVGGEDSGSFVGSHWEAEAVFTVGEHGRGLSILTSQSTAGELA